MANKLVCDEINISSSLDFMKIYNDPNEKFKKIVSPNDDNIVEYINQNVKADIVTNLAKVQTYIGVNR